MMDSSDTNHLNLPFTTGALNRDSNFWASYISHRPSPPESFLLLINDYHHTHGRAGNSVAHDVGTRPGNIAQRLLPYFDLVVGSDVSVDALAVARSMTPVEARDRLIFIESPAEELETAPLPETAGVGKTDLLLVSECMPLLDASKALESFNKMLRPGGTLAIYFYGRPIFLGADAEDCNRLWERLADSAVQCFHPIKDTPSFPFYHRSATTMHSWLDNIALPPQSWVNVERIKWNYHSPLSFCGQGGYDFGLEAVDRTQPREKKKEFIEPSFWSREMNATEVEAYLSSVLPGYCDRPNSDTRLEEIHELIQTLQKVMGGEGLTRQVTFPVSLILATKRG
ncbi:S-adenosyl-L-methionine-dependent methyltransferase [Xylariaceae sp. FL1272]|nr:S-adenosyl-L-methionine-dependent methyltransferase [Xylariaceae sp. FL1272]